MKKVFVGLMVVVMLTYAAAVWAADESQAKKEQTPPQPQVQGPRPPREPGMGMRGRGPTVQGPAGMQQAYEEMQKRREEEHKKAIAELEEIKKIAESEKATKTVEALQKMIDKKNADFKKSTEDMEKRRTERMEQVRQRQQEMTPPATPANPPVKEGKKVEKEAAAEKSSNK